MKENSILRSLLLDKNFKLFIQHKNNRNRLKWEIILAFPALLYIMYYYNIYSSRLPFEPLISQNTTILSTNTSISMCEFYGYTNISSLCYVAIGDISTGDGCSNNLTNFIDNELKFCSIAQTESEVVEYYNQNGIMVPICKCVPTSLFTNKTYIDDENIITALEFDENNFGIYKIYGSNLGFTKSNEYAKSAIFIDNNIFWVLSKENEINTFPIPKLNTNKFFTYQTLSI
jgi:hypothetical protein